MRTRAEKVCAAPGARDLVLHRVVDDAYARRIADVVRSLALDDHKTARFPGPNPVSLDTSHFDVLAGEPYVVCEKTDGVRFALLCCTLPGPHPLDEPLRVAALVDRKHAAFLLPMRALPTVAYQGTLLDGEIARNKTTGRWDFLVFDAVSVSGIPVLNAPLRDRMAATRAALDAYRPHDADPVRLHLKTFLPCDGGMPGVDAHLAVVAERYDIDGVVLTPQMRPVVYGRHPALFKLKSGSRHTVDFLLCADATGLAVFDNGRHVPVGRLRQTCAVAAPGAVLECHLVGDDTWDLVTVRTDKTTANDMLTFRNTLINVRENLGLEDVKRVVARAAPARGPGVS